MNVTTFLSMENLFKSLGYNYENIEPGSTIDVSDKNIKIKSYDLDTEKIVFGKILFLIRKEDEVVYEVRDSVGSVVLRGTKGHRIIYLDNILGWNWISLGKLSCISEGVVTLCDDESKIVVKAFETDNSSPILDIGIEELENYFSNGILSHNTSGGNALKYYASQRLVLSKTPAKKDNQGNILNQPIHVKVIKNKLAPPYKETDLEIVFGKGLSTENEVLDLAIEHGVVDKSGAWYSFENERLGQGSVNVIQNLTEHPELFASVYQALINKLR